MNPHLMLVRGALNDLPDGALVLNRILFCLCCFTKKVLNAPLLAAGMDEPARKIADLDRRRA
jgi:hypothetical protein